VTNTPPSKDITAPKSICVFCGSRPGNQAHYMDLADDTGRQIAQPGGIGTMEEAVEIMSWMRMRLHAKPIVFLSTDGYWQPLVDLMLHTIETGFSPEWMKSEILRASSTSQALEIIQKHWQREVVDRTLKIDIDEV